MRSSPIIAKQENKFSELIETSFTSIRRIGVADDISQLALKDFVFRIPAEAYCIFKVMTHRKV